MSEGHDVLADVMERLGPAAGIGLAVGLSPGKERVRVDASQPFTYLDLMPAQAVALASVLQHYAAEIEPELRIGATGKFPQGHSRPGDEGELTMMLRFEPLSGQVEMHFGKPVTWVSMTPEELEAFARRVLGFAKQHREGPEVKS